MHKNILTTAIFVISSYCIVGCNSSVSSNSPPITLRFNFPKDTSFQYLIKSHIELTPELEDKEITINQDMTVATSYNVLSNNPNSKSLSVTYNRLILSSGGDAINTEFDTDNDDGSIAIYQGIRDIINKPFRMTFSQEGKILSASAIRVNNRIVSDSSVRKALVQSLYIYPTTDVKVGDTWQRTFSTSIGFITVNVVNNYKLMFINEGIAHVAVSAKLFSDSTTQMGNAKMKLNGIQTGSLDIVIHSGLITNGKFKQQLSGSIDFAGRQTPVNIVADTHIMGIQKDKTP